MIRKLWDKITGKAALREELEMYKAMAAFLALDAARYRIAKFRHMDRINVDKYLKRHGYSGKRGA